jgi:protocatechuate 3,4-dioxygenase beta subunit
MNATTRRVLRAAPSWLHSQRRRTKLRRALSVAARFAAELLEPRTLLSSIDHLIGTSPPIKGSELVLDLPSDPANVQTFHALSSDSTLGTLDSGLVTAQTWDFSAHGASQKLSFKGTSPDGTSYQGDIHLAPKISGSLYITKNSQTVRYSVSPASPNVSISGEVFNDLNGDGALGTGEPGLAGWKVDLVDTATNSLVAETTTGTDGAYTFANTFPGTYTILEKLQSGWVQTAPPPPGTYSILAFDGQSFTGNNFGDFQLVSVSGNVYNDINGNGQQNSGEPGLANWEVDLKGAGNNVVATATTDANGNYAIAGIGPGSYTLAEVLQVGFIQTQPVNPNFYSFTTSSGANLAGRAFGDVHIPENLSGFVYNDLNGNGSSDGGTDPALSGQTINVLDSSNKLVASTTTAADGTYSFTNLPFAQYTVEDVVPAGWTITQPTNPPGTYTVPAASGNHPGLDFGNFQLVSVSGNVYNDLNGNGQHDAGEPALANWTVEVQDAGNNVVASATTDASGNYTITGVGPGSFTLVEAVQSGWIITQPTNPSFYSFTTSSGSNVTGGIFGDFHTISVSGSVYNDQNGDGLRNVAEPGLQGWTVNLEDSVGNVLASVVSDSNGNYSFTGVGPGSYMVAEVVQPNYVQTQPLFPTDYSFVSVSGHNLAALVFGDHFSPALNPTQVIDNGQAGYSETGSWNTVVGGFNGTNRVAHTVNSGSPTATATWDFTGVGSTLIDVWVTYSGRSQYSKAAPFTVYDGGASLGTQFFNESILVTQSQGASAQGSYGGVGWLELGTFDITSGEIKVVLNNLASGNFVDADGVLIVAHGPGVQPSHGAPSRSGFGNANATGLIIIGPPSVGPSTQSSTGNRGRNPVPAVTIPGVSTPARLQVISNQGDQPVAKPYWL